MIADSGFGPTYRLRVSNGDLAGQWLQMLSVTKGGVPFTVTHWEGVERQASQYTFHPHFVSDESGAFRAINQEAAERFQRILQGLGIETEIVPTSPKQ